MLALALMCGVLPVAIGSHQLEQWSLALGFAWPNAAFLCLLSIALYALAHVLTESSLGRALHLR